MKRSCLLLLLLLPALCSAATSAQIYFPAEVAGGKVSPWSSGALIFTGNGWGEFGSGKIDLRLQWVDRKDELRMFMCVWTFELPEGRFLLGAERKEEKIVFTLTREGEKQALLKSEPYPIATWAHTKMNQTPATVFKKQG